MAQLRKGQIIFIPDLLVQSLNYEVNNESSKKRNLLDIIRKKIGD